MSTPLLVQTPICAGCGDKAKRLLIRSVMGHFCGPCWREAGEPPPPRPTRAEVQDAEIQWAGRK